MMFPIVSDMIKKIKNESPLILNLSNVVTSDFVANGLLSVGASPIMSQANQETEDLIKISKALVINIGTLNHEFIQLIQQACRIANELNIPIILDPVGAGASAYRTDICKSLLANYQIAIVRANAGEIMALSGLSAQTKGVASMAETTAAIESALALAFEHHVVVCMSGSTDIIIDKKHQQWFHRGSILMPMVTGTGCLLSAIVAAFHSVHADRFTAAVAASIFYSICGEMAAEKAHGPGSFKMHFLDSLNIIPAKSHYE